MFRFFPLIAVIYVITINIIAIVAYYADKRYAEKKKQRISEFNLLLLGAFGASIGSAIGMIAFNHKTKHWKFRIYIPLFIAIHFGILVLIF